MSQDGAAVAPYGLYLHVPFCASKCRYCDFLSFPGVQAAWKRRYVSALKNEIKASVGEKWRRPLTIFMGGGTPTSLPLADMEDLLVTLTDAVDLNAVAEFTVEVNPGSAQKEMLLLLRRYGVNRLSFGVQSLEDAVLQQLGRLHRKKDVIRAVAESRAAGFDNINFDLIYGLPGQTHQSWERVLTEALLMEPVHLSLYQLMVEPGTAIARDLHTGKLPTVDEDLAAAMWDTNGDILPRFGFYQYEISNYAKPGYPCKHNRLYWELQNYLGLGLGATGWERPQRFVTTADLATYCNHWLAGKSAPQSIERVDVLNQMRELMMMSLRMNEGLSHQRFESLFGTTPEHVFPEALSQSEADGSMIRDDHAWQLTDQGRRLGNIVIGRFF